MTNSIRPRYGVKAAEIRRSRGRRVAGAVARDMANGLGLVAAPAFAILAAAVAVVPEGSGPICGPGHPASAIGGMATMYLVMSAVHLQPWLKLISAHLVPAAPTNPGT